VEFKDGKYLSKEMKMAFVYTFIIGVLCHFAYLSAIFFNEDSIAHYITRVIGAGVPQGRWAAGVLAFVLRKTYNTQALIGICCILGISAQNAILTSIFELKNRITIFFMCAVLVVMPSLAYTSCYVYSFDQYGIELFLSALCVYLTYKFKHGVWPAMFIMMFNLSLYQAALPQLMTLCVLVLLFMLVKGDAITDVINKARTLILMGIGGGLLYLLSVKVSLWVFGLELYTYKGISGMGEVPIVEYLLGIPKAYINFWDYFFGTNYFYSSFGLKIAYGVVLSVVPILTFVLARKNVKKNDKEFRIRILLTGVALAVLPMTINVIDVVAPDTGTYTVIMYPMAYVFVCLLIMVEQSQIKINNALIRKGILTIISIAMLVVSWEYIVIDNIYYMKADILTQRTESFYERLASAVESTEGYESGMNLLVLGTYPNRNYRMAENEFDKIIINDVGLRNEIIGLPKGKDSRNTEKVHNYLESILGLDLKNGFKAERADHKIAKILASEEYAKMGMWPAEDSVKVINDYVVVNFREPFYVRAKSTEDNTIRFQIMSANGLPEGYTFAFRVYKDGKEIFWDGNFKDKDYYKIKEAETGTYSARCYIKDERGRIIEDSLYPAFDIEIKEAEKIEETEIVEK